MGAFGPFTPGLEAEQASALVAERLRHAERARLVRVSRQTATSHGKPAYPAGVQRSVLLFVLFGTLLAALLRRAGTFLLHTAVWVEQLLDVSTARRREPLISDCP